MHRLTPQLGVVGMVLLIGLLAAVGTTPRPSPFRLDLVPISATYRSPVFVADPGDGTRRVFVVEQRGVIKIVHDGVPSKHPFLDIRELVKDTGGEQGLLSLAFHPNFAQNATFFLAYTDSGNDLIVASFTAAAERPDRADPDSGRTVIRIRKRYADHNGGLLCFGPDGYLYVGVGDGGVEAEPQGNAQRLDTLLGKLLRVDIDRPSAGRAYGIPPDNPFVGVQDARPEIWAYGLRNPWRFSFDRERGDLYIADVGWGGPEEVNVQPVTSVGGENYGWNELEGRRCLRPTADERCDGTGMVEPIWHYEHAELKNGCAIVGGYAYRGMAFPDLVGAYLAADVCTGRVWSLRMTGGRWTATVLLEVNTVVSSFAEDSAGELYLIGLRGHVYRLAPGTGRPSDSTLTFSCRLTSANVGGWECGAANRRTTDR